MAAGFRKQRAERRIGIRAGERNGAAGHPCPQHEPRGVEALRHDVGIDEDPGADDPADHDHRRVERAEGAFERHGGDYIEAGARISRLIPSAKPEARSLNMSSVNPITEFKSAVERAQARQVDTAPAALATADADGRPSVRMVLLRGVDDRGFSFFTNYNSRKGRELAANPHAALCFRR